MNFEDNLADAIRSHTAGPTPPPDLRGIRARARRRRLVQVGLATAATLAVIGGAAAITLQTDTDHPRPSGDNNGPGTSTPPTSGPTTAPPPADPNREYIATATVLESPEHGPQLCLGGILESLPPQCGGPDIVGWDWKRVGGAVSRAGTTWGDYMVVGTFADGIFSLTRPAIESGKYNGPEIPSSSPPDADLSTPCPTPAGGWRVLDPGMTTEAALERTIRAAQRLDVNAGLWLDQSRNASTSEEDMNDPTKLTLNVRVTGDLAATESMLRETWGGALCVSHGLRTVRELLRIQNTVAHTPGMLSASSGDDVVDLQVVFDDGALQRQFDDEYGVGVVRVYSALQPVSE